VGVTVFGGDGNDFFEEDDLGARVFAEAGNDTIVIRSREANYRNFLDGGSGIDLVVGAGGGRNLLDLREYRTSRTPTSAISLASSSATTWPTSSTARMRSAPSPSTAWAATTR
jgi:Ca2+-binding RTX toxin-like protein